MRYSDDPDLDTSAVEDMRGGGGGGFGGHGLAVGGGGLGLGLGLEGLVIVALIEVLGGGTGGAGTGTGTAVGGFPGIGQGQSADSTQLAAECTTGRDAHAHVECAVMADLNSTEDFWRQQLGSRYTETHPVFFSGSAQTGCGSATSGTTPFVCPADRLVHLDLSFLDTLQKQFGAEGGLFVDADVLAHEDGHHVQDILATSNGHQAWITGPTSGWVRLELQAGCYAGVRAQHAQEVPTASGRPLITQISPDDVSRALDTASRIGDDVSQRTLGGGQLDRDSVTHGSSGQRQEWFPAGYSSGDANARGTFGTSILG